MRFENLLGDFTVTERGGGGGREKEEGKERGKETWRERERQDVGAETEEHWDLSISELRDLGHQASFLNVSWNDQPRGQKGRWKCVELINHVVLYKSQGLGRV